MGGTSLSKDFIGPFEEQQESLPIVVEQVVQKFTKCRFFRPHIVIESFLQPGAPARNVPEWRAPKQVAWPPSVAAYCGLAACILVVHSSWLQPLGTKARMEHETSLVAAMSSARSLSPWPLVCPSQIYVARKGCCPMAHVSSLG